MLTEFEFLGTGFWRIVLDYNNDDSTEPFMRESESHFAGF